MKQNKVDSALSVVEKLSNLDSPTGILAIEVRRLREANKRQRVRIKSLEKAQTADSHALIKLCAENNKLKEELDMAVRAERKKGGV